MEIIENGEEFGSKIKKNFLYLKSTLCIIKTS